MQKEILSFSKIHIGAEQVITAKYDELLMSDGKVYKDTMSGLWNVPLGYSNENIKQSMINQLVKLPYTSNFSGYHSETTEKYANEICKRTNMSRVYFTNSGSAAVETAIKLSGKQVAVCGKHSYHGSTILSANASDQDINKFWNIQNPMSVHKFDGADQLASICKGLFDLSFVIIEPVIGAGGVYEWQPEVWNILKEYQQKGGVVILDETVTGFGKLGTMFAFEKYNIEPDMIILGKGITNGYFPMGACLINERIEKTVKMFNHGFTYSGHPIGCAVALETLKEIDKLDLEHKQINGITRQYGCMGAIDFETPKQSLTFIKKMREKGYILEDGSENVSTAVFCLPYIFKDHNEFEEAIKCTIMDI
jgi:putrescine aminotransferase|tara:strand:+ start:237 stop:1331 length:1095 start_codon:yes stop_codon:yes gene_type:complete